MQAQIKSWGNSQAIRLAKELLEIAGMKANEDVKLVDLKVRRFSVIDSLNMPNSINIADAVQGIFDYI